MKLKKGVIIIGIIITSCLLIKLASNVYKNINQKRLYKEAELSREKYRSDVMRFDVHIEKGQYKYVEGNLIFSYNKGENFDITFDEDSENMNIYENIDTKYSEYVITENKSYISINIDNQVKVMEHKVPISSDNLSNLRSFMKSENSNSIHIFPFNDGSYCLIRTDKNQYIMNIETNEILWTRGGYYESPRVNIYNDTLSCGGDLSAKTYVFNKYGELIKTKKPIVNYVSLISNIIVVFGTLCILFIIQRIIKLSAKNTGLRVIANLAIAILMILIVIFTIFGIALVLA